MNLSKCMRVVALVCYGGLALVLGPFVLVYGDRTNGSGIIAVGLMCAFFNPWRPDDERGRLLRIKAVAAGFYASFTILFIGLVLVRTLSKEALMRAMRHEPPLPSLWGVWDAIILTLVLAQLLFWWWSYRDGVEPKRVTGWRRVVQMCLTGR